MSAPVLAIQNLRVQFARGGGAMLAVRGASLAVQNGECVGIVGESGCGKTQMFMAVMGLLARNARADGSVRFAGAEILGGAQARLPVGAGRLHQLRHQGCIRILG